jgi:hypothetical protein
MAADDTSAPTVAPPRFPWAAVVPLLTAAAALGCYAATAARTITWWEGSQYPLWACTLSIGGPPGSLLLTLLGWLASLVPVVHPVAFRLNLLAGLIAAVTVALVTRVAIELSAPEERRPGAAEIAAGAVAGLAFAISLSVWTHATQFTPYILTAAFTALILAAALAWWRRAGDGDALGRLFLIFLLLGLDFSVHRTNALLLPAVLLWIGLRRPRAWLRPRTWAACGAGLVLGLAFHLLLIPLSLRDPPVDLGEPRDLARFWSYVSVQLHGGSFLFDILPRKADFLRVQLGDYLQFLRQNLAPAGLRPALAILPGLLVLVGWVVAVRTATRRSLGLLVFFLCASLGAVVYFNLPAHYFRGMDRHYLPSLVLLAPLMAVGAAAFLRLAARAPHGMRRVPVAALGILLALVPLGAWRANQRACDLSRVRFAETYSRDVLEPLPPGAILLTNGDNDTFPLWYLQLVEHVRPDVAVVNIPLMNTPWYVAQLRRHVPGFAGLLEGRAVPEPATVGDTTVTVPWGPAASAGLALRAAPPDSLTIRLSGILLGQDFVALGLLRLGGQRPLCVACTVSPQNLLWLQPYLRLEGLALRVVPSTDPAVHDVEHLRHQLLERVRYVGVADTTLELDPTSGTMCGVYMGVLLSLAQAQKARGDAPGALETLRFTATHAPPTRLGMDAAAWEQMLRQAESAAAATAGAARGTTARP